MANKKVLVIAYYFPPMGLSGVQRTVKFVKYLPEYGWDPIVLTTSSNAFYAFDEEMDKEVQESDVKVYRTKNRKKAKKQKDKGPVKFPNYLKQKIGRAVIQSLFVPDRRIGWRKRAVFKAERIFREHDIDAIFATAPPFTDFLVAKDLSEQYNVPYLVDYRDVWIDNPFHYFPTPMHKNKCIKMETDILNTAGRAIVTSRHTKELLVQRYGFLSYDDVSIITHGYDADDFVPYRDIKPDPSKFVITHSGLFQDNRTPKFFFKALANFLQKNEKARAVTEARFVGIMRPAHYKMIKKYKLDKNIVNLGYLNHPDVIQNLMESDVLWLMLNDDVRTPGKLYEYIGAQKPLLACLPEGVMQKTALDTKAAIATGPKDVNAIENAIETYFNLWEKQGLPEPDPDYAMEFDRKILTKSLARELELIAEM